MRKKSVDSLAAVQSSDQVRILIEPSVCGQCEQICWSVEAKARGEIGNEHWETVLLYVDHQGLAAALSILSRRIGTLGGQARNAEERQYLIEHHPRLW